MSSEFSPTQQAIDDALQRQGNLTVLFTNAIASHIGLSATEFECLSLLREGPLTAGMLAERCGLTTGAITGLVDRLERSGFVERQTDPADRRKVLVNMKRNETASQKIEELYKPLAKAIGDLTNEYSESELRTIVDFLQRSNTVLDELTTEMASRRKME